MNFYCNAHALWCFYSNEVFNKLRVAYNNTFTLLFSINGVISISSTFMCLGIDTFNVILRKSMSSLLFEPECVIIGFDRLYVSRLFY